MTTLPSQRGVRARRSRVGTGINRGRDNGILNGGRIDTAAKCRVPRGRIEIRRRNRERCRGMRNW